MSRVPSPFINTCLSELLREEQRLATQTVLQQAITSRRDDSKDTPYEIFNAIG